MLLELLRLVVVQNLNKRDNAEQGPSGRAPSRGATFITTFGERKAGECGRTVEKHTCRFSPWSAVVPVIVAKVSSK